MRKALQIAQNDRDAVPFGEPIYFLVEQPEKSLGFVIVVDANRLPLGCAALVFAPPDR